MSAFNDRKLEGIPAPTRRRISILVDFPEEHLESVIIQWENLPPTVLVQLKKNPQEPLQFPGKRLDIPGNDELPKDQPLAVDRPLLDFVDPLSGRIFGRMAYEADILFSQRAFITLQPEPDLVLPPEPLWECRTEALRAIGAADSPLNAQPAL
ncbi:MAG: hypothetical protein ACJ763_10845 [Bdellovibrionia bacterium]